MRHFRLLLIFSALVAFATSAQAERIGSVSTVWKAIGPNSKIVIEVFDDPDVKNVSCWVSRPTQGGVSGAVGLAEDPSNGSIACRQTGPVTVDPALKAKLRKQTKKGGVIVFKERTSAVFKSIQVSRMYDEKRDTLVYLIWSDKVVDGSPKNSLSVVVLAPWPS
jgi:CreA protein